jgi:hypothetical protein
MLKKAACVYRQLFCWMTGKVPFPSPCFSEKNFEPGNSKFFHKNSENNKIRKTKSGN